MSLSLPQTALSLSCGFDMNIHTHNVSSLKPSSATTLCSCTSSYRTPNPPLRTTHTHTHTPNYPLLLMTSGKPPRTKYLKPLSAAVPDLPPLDLTESNVRQVLADARAELGQIFDTSVGITGIINLFVDC